MRKKLTNNDLSDIGRAANEIGKYCRKYGFIEVRQTKEKWGSCRVYCSFGVYDLHSLIWSGYHYTQWSRFGSIGKILAFLDRKVIEPLIRYSRINRIIIPYQEFIYKMAYKRAMKKYPHIRPNIKHYADHDYLLKNLCTKN
jgi:hypothetical protein